MNETKSENKRPSQTTNITLDKGWRWAVPTLLLIQLVLGLPLLSTVPRFYNDECWEASLGQSLAVDGTLRHPIIEGWGGMHIHFVQNQVVLPFVCAAFYKLAGLSVLTSRMASLLVSLLAVMSINAVMRRWFDWRQAFFITLATILNPWFFEIARRTRPEIYYIAFAMAALALALRSLDSRARVPALLAGVFAALASLSHPTGLVVIAVLAVGALVAAPRHALLRVTLWMVLGYALAMLPYAIYVAWAVQNPDVSFIKQMQGAKEVVMTDVAALLDGELYRWRHYFQWPSGAPLCLLMLVAWIAAWIRSTAPDRAVAVTILLFAIAIPFASVNTTSRYVVALAPFFAALLIRLIVRVLAVRGTSSAEVGGATSTFRRPRAILAVACALIYLGSSVGGIAFMFYRLHNADVYRFCDRVAGMTGPDARIYGRMIFWIGGDRYRYGPFPLDHRWRTTFEMLSPHHYDFAVRTAWNFGSSGGVSRPPATMPAFRPEDPVDRVCERFGVKTGEFRDPDFGPVEVYRLDWTHPSTRPPIGRD